MGQTTPSGFTDWLLLPLQCINCNRYWVQIKHEDLSRDIQELGLTSPTSRLNDKKPAELISNKMPIEQKNFSIP